MLFLFMCMHEVIAWLALFNGFRVDFSHCFENMDAVGHALDLDIFNIASKLSNYGTPNRKATLLYLSSLKLIRH